jgi:stearoyl-CoA desaturase (Delta-9 desaturase)
MPIFCFVLPSLIPWYFWGESLFDAYMIAGVSRYVTV